MRKHRQVETAFKTVANSVATTAIDTDTVIAAVKPAVVNTYATSKTITAKIIEENANQMMMPAELMINAESIDEKSWLITVEDDATRTRTIMETNQLVNLLMLKSFSQISSQLQKYNGKITVNKVAAF